MEVRQHRGGYEESMATVETIAGTERSIVEWINKVLTANGFNKEVTAADLKLTPLGFDERNAWDTYIVAVEGYGVVGHSDGAPMPIYDLEHFDQNRIRQERDLLAQAIAKMGVSLGHISPNAVLTGPHLIMICEDIVRLQDESGKPTPQQS